MEYMGVPVATQLVTSADAASNLPSNVLSCQAVLISVEGSDGIRYCVGGSTPDRTNPTGHFVGGGEVIRLTNNNQVKSFKFCNAVAESNAPMQVTGEFV